MKKPVKKPIKKKCPPPPKASHLRSFLMTFLSVFVGYFIIELLTIDFQTILLEKDVKLILVPFAAAGLRALLRYQDEKLNKTNGSIQ